MIALAGLDARLRPYAERAIEYAHRLGVTVEVTSVRRSEDEQRRLYQRWLAGKNRYPVARPGESAHQYGAAWDSTVKPEHQDLWNAIRRAFGWNVPGNDLVHAELPDWDAWRSALRYS